MSLRRLRSGPVGAFLLVVLVLSGCAGLPTSTEVERASDASDEGDLVTYQPAPPAPGAEPTEVVAGFLDAMLAFPVSSATASAYLSTAAAEDWAAGAGVTIYRAPVIRVGAVGEDSAVVELAAEQNGTLDRTGHFQQATGPLDATFQLVRDDGEWRIANPPAGLAVTRGYFETYYRAFDVQRFDAAGERLVADPVHLQIGDRLATSLTSALVADVTPRVAGETRTYVPPAEDWNPAVTVSGGRATVEFDTSLTTLDVEVRRRLSAQVVRTLGQVPEVTTVRIVGSDGPIVAGGTADQPVTSWERYDHPPPVGQPAAVVEDVLSILVAGTPTPVADVPDGLPATADLVAVRPGGWAAVTTDGTLRIADGETEGEVVLPTSEAVAIAWDAQERLWVADRPGGRLRVRLVSAGAALEVPVAGDLTGVTSFALDPGTTRYAVTRESGDVLAGTVAAGDVPSLGPGTPVAPDVVAPGDVVWTGVASIAVVGDGETGRQVYRARIDGSPSDALAGTAPRLPNVTITAVAAGVGDGPDLYVTDDRGRLWFLPVDGSWRLVGVMARGLSSGR